MSKLFFPEFKDIKVSTKTFTASTNLKINIKNLFELLPITPYVVIPKKRGRKKKGVVQNPNKNVPEGSIITVKYENKIKGVELKPKKQKSYNPKWFRNSITVVIIFDKPINFKVCRNGTFQMTGCKSYLHAEKCIKSLWEFMKNNKDVYEIVYGKNIQALIIPSMRNIDFSLGFNVDREKLNMYICRQNNFHCLLETSFGYTGVNIKVPLKKNIAKMKIKKMTYYEKSECWRSKWTEYEEYLDTLSEKDKEKKKKHERYNTFLVFHSGKVIMSGLTEEFMEDIYYVFVETIKKLYNKIEERLIE